MYSSFADFAYHAVLQNTLSLEAKFPERELRKAAEPLSAMLTKTLHKIKDMNIVLNPNSDQLEEMKKWLIEEDLTSNDGFYCNWNIIQNSFDKQNLIILEKNNKSIGFVCWNTFGEPYAIIDIMEIHPKFRKQGFGEAFYKKIEEFFKSKRFKVIKLHCSPPSSEAFWQKMEFQKFPKRGYSESELTYYKPLIKTNIPTLDDVQNKLELWDMEPYQVNEEKKARWRWEIGNNKRPILHPCNPNWNLRLSKNGKIIKEDKIKYFDRKNEIEIGPFLFIENI